MGIIERAYDVAVSNDRNPKHRHVAMAIRGGNILAIAVNHEWVHAEVAVLKKIWSTNRPGVRILTLRVRRDGSVGLGRPCARCVDYMRSVGVRQVSYSTADGSMARMKL